MVPSGAIPGNRVYPGTSQHWTYGQRIAYRDSVRATIILTVVFLGALAVAVLLGLRL